MIERAVIFDEDGRALHWRGSEGSDGGFIPDSRSLWEAIWENRDRVAGVAHSHPGSGIPQPSYTDETTFDAIEAGLGKRLWWPIITVDHVEFFRFAEGAYYRCCASFDDPYHWNKTVAELRRLSGIGGQDVRHERNGSGGSDQHGPPQRDLPGAER